MPAFLTSRPVWYCLPEVIHLRNILESIYYGHEAVSVSTFKVTPRSAQMLDEASQLEDKLKALLPEETKLIFERFVEVSSEISSISNLGDFKAGVQLGVSFILAALYDENSCSRRITHQDEI